MTLEEGNTPLKIKANFPILIYIFKTKTMLSVDILENAKRFKVASKINRYYRYSNGPLSSTTNILEPFG